MADPTPHGATGLVEPSPARRGWGGLWESLLAGWGLVRSMVVYWRPGRQWGLRRLYASFVAPGDLVFDVGAHLGDRTRAFQALGARVVALEPQPRLLPWLRFRVGALPRVTILPRAVGASAGTAHLAVSRKHPTVSSLSTRWRREVTARQEGFRHVRWEEAHRVEVTTLDVLRGEYGSPAFCKIDVEGFEEEVLAGLSAPLPALSLEFVAGDLAAAVRCVGRLERLGRYRFNVVPGEGRTFLFPSWVAPEEVVAWLAAGGGGHPSGDLYARLEPGGAQPSRGAIQPSGSRSDSIPSSQ